MGKIKDLLRKWLYPAVQPEIKPVEVIHTYQNLQHYQFFYKCAREAVDGMPDELITKMLVRKFSEQMAESIIKNLKTDYDPKIRAYIYELDYWMRDEKAD